MRPKNSNNFYNARVLYPKERVLILRNKTEWPRGKIVTFLMQSALCFLSHQFHHKFWSKPSPQLFISLIIFHPQNCTTKLLSSPSKRLKSTLTFILLASFFFSFCTYLVMNTPSFWPNLKDVNCLNLSRIIKVFFAITLLVMWFLLRINILKVTPSHDFSEPSYVLHDFSEPSYVA